jgi:PAS domain S-box-containing protein
MLTARTKLSAADQNQTTPPQTPAPRPVFPSVLLDPGTDLEEPAQIGAAVRAEAGWLTTLVHLLPDFVFVKDTEGRFLMVNQALAKAYARTPADLVSMSEADFLPAEIAARLRGGERAALEENRTAAHELTLRFPDGKVRTLVVNLAPFCDPAGKVCGVVGSARDVSEQKRADEALRLMLQRANRTLKAIRDCHEAMLRAKTEDELLDEVCRIIVQSGGERMAWVGYVEKGTGKSVRPVASAGVSHDYLQSMHVSWADVCRGRGPVGTAIRTGRISFCANTLTDRRFAPWREGARRQGFGSVIALPLKSGHQCFGALAIYGAEPDAFDESERLMLMDLANDLAFGINTLRLRRERKQWENESQQSIEKEQERIGRDLHDGLCQLLVGAKFRSVHLQNLCAGKLPSAKMEAITLEKSLNHAIEQARNLARGLEPIKVASGGLEAALQSLADSVVGGRTMRCFCRIQPGLAIADHQTASHLYRIAQEAVQNALKHARASQILIALTATSQEITLTVKDDGVGMTRRRPGSGLGLNNMETRARLIGGRLAIRRRKPRGTAVSCCVPRNRVLNA